MEIVCKKCGHRFPIETWQRPTEANIICAICGITSEIAKFRLGIKTMGKKIKALAICQKRDQEFEPIFDETIKKE